MSLEKIVVHCPLVWIIGEPEMGCVYQVSWGHCEGGRMVSFQMSVGIWESHLAAGRMSRGCPSSKAVSVVIV